MKSFMVMIMLVAVAADVMATPPSVFERNIDIEAELIGNPQKEGDLFQVKWSFVFHKDTYEEPARIRAVWDSAAAKAFLYIFPKQQFVSGDSVWWGKPAYDVKYNFMTTYRIIGAKTITIVPEVEFHGAIMDEGDLMSRNAGKALMIPFPHEEKPSTFIDIYGDDTITTIVGGKLPQKGYQLVDGTNKFIETPVVDDKAKAPGLEKVGIIDLAAINNGDSISLIIPPDSSIKIDIINKLRIPYKIADSGDIHVRILSPYCLEVMISHNMKRRLVELDFGGKKRLYIKFRLQWELDGTFRYNIPNGSSAIGMNGMHCFFFEWVIDHFEQRLTLIADPYGYFSFPTAADTVAVQVVSSNAYSFVWYAEDSCLDFSFGERGYNHSYVVYVINPQNLNLTIPDVYTIISDPAIASSFHLANIMTYSNYSIGFPESYPRVPVYFLNGDPCVTGSDFGGFSIGDVPGIRILGDAGSANNCDQWDSSVVFHELGHFYEYEKAQMPPNSGGPHLFYKPALNPNMSKFGTAFTEGWATFFSCCVRNQSAFIDYKKHFPDTNLWIEMELPNPDVPYYLDYNQRLPSSTTPYYEGAIVEGAIALALWDLYDVQDDDNYFVGSELRGHNNDHNRNTFWNGPLPIFDVMEYYDPQPLNPDHDHCWNIYEFINGWRLTGYPYDETFKNIFKAHNIIPFVAGDVNMDELINMKDITDLIKYLYKNGTRPYPAAVADDNADCVINIKNITYLLDYLYHYGPALLVGCIED